MPLFATDGFAPVETKGVDRESFISTPENPELLAEQVEGMAPLACFIATLQCSCRTVKTQYCDGGSHGTPMEWYYYICGQACGEEEDPPGEE